MSRALAANAPTCLVLRSQVNRICTVTGYSERDWVVALYTVPTIAVGIYMHRQAVNELAMRYRSGAEQYIREALPSHTTGKRAHLQLYTISLGCRRSSGPAPTPFIFAFSLSSKLSYLLVLLRPSFASSLLCVIPPSTLSVVRRSLALLFQPHFSTASRIHCAECGFTFSYVRLTCSTSTQLLPMRVGYPDRKRRWFALCTEWRMS